MTKDTAIREQARAVFLAALMVLSVSVGTVALSGGAAAAVTDVTLETDDPIRPNEEITVNVSTENDNDVVIGIDADDSGTIESDEIVNAVTASDGYAEITITPTDVAEMEDSSTGTYYVAAKEETDSQGDIDTSSFAVDADLTTMVEVDGVAPTFSDEHTRQVTTTTPTLTVPLSDVNTSVNESTIEVDLTNGDEVIHQVNAPSSKDDGISYDASAEEVTIDLSESELEPLENGNTYTASVEAEDAVGNSNTTSFDVVVDTGAPTFSLEQPTDDVVGSPTQTIDISIADTNLNDSTAEVTVSGPDGELFTNTSEDGVYDAGTNSFTVNPGNNGVPELPNGTITVSVSAADEHGNADSAEFTFEVDNEKPTVDFVATNQSAYYGDDTTMGVMVDFSEPVDASTVSADIHVDEETNSLTIGEFEQGADDDPSMVFATYDLSAFDASENASAKVVVTAGEDTVSNTANLTAGSNSTTFAIDTIAPTVTIDTNADADGRLPSTLTGLVDIEQYVSASQADGNEAKIGWKVGDGDVTWFDNAASVDTRDITEGDVTIVAQATDENGTTTTETADVTVDNFEPSVELKYPDATLVGNESGVEYDVKDLVEVSNNGTNVVTDYGVHKLADGESVDDVTDADIDFSSDTFEVSGDGTYVFAVKVESGTLITGSMDAMVFDSNELEITAKQNSEDAGDLNVTVESDHELDSLNLTVESTDDYYKQSSETFSSPDEIEETQLKDGTWEYSIVYDAPRDGSYEVTIDNASKSVFSVSNAGTDGAVAEGSAPEITDADVVGLDSNGNSVVNVRFTEPVNGVDPSDFTFGDDRASVTTVTNTGATGEVRITFDREIQTGDDAAILAVEKGVYSDANGNDNIAESDYIDSIELDLQKGLNYVSVPLETGSVSLNELKKEGELDDVEAIWAYEGGEWVSYTPGADDNKLTALEGGDGYVVKTESDTKVDVRGYTRLAISEGAPEVEGIEAGWNLVGHYHEESKDATDSLGFTPDGDIGVIGQGDGYALERVSNFEPGEGYWIFVRESGNLYTATEDGGSAGLSISGVTVTDGDDIVTNGDEVTITVDSASAEAGVYAVVADATKLNGDNEVVLTEQEDGSYSTTVTVDRSEDVDSSPSVDVTVIDSYGQTASDTDGITVDTTAPSASITSPSDGDSMQSQNSITGTASDNDGVASVDLTITNGAGDTWDGSAFTSSESTVSATYDSSAGTWSYDSTGITTEDTYTVTATATDAAGNLVDSSAVSYTIDTTSPTISSYSVTNSSSQDVKVTLTTDEQLGSVSASVTGAETGTLSGFASGSGDFTETDNGDGTFTYTATHAGSTDGDYTVTLDAAADTAGNDGAISESGTVTVDTTSPSFKSASIGTYDSTNDETSVTLTITEATSGLEGSSITQSDFAVTDSGGSGTSVTVNSIDKSGADGATGDVSITVVVSGDQTGSNLEIALATGESIADKQGNTLSSDNIGSSVTTA